MSSNVFAYIENTFRRFFGNEDKESSHIKSETRNFRMYDKVWWRGEKWYVVGYHWTVNNGVSFWELELENYHCVFSSHSIRYVDSREVKNLVKLSAVIV